MYGERLDQLIPIQCACCQKWVAVRLDPDDLERHRTGGFVRRDGLPYLDASLRELFISRCCSDCWALLCPSSPLAYC